MSRHRHRKNPVDKTAAAERDARRRELADKLAMATGLPADDVRIDLASWSALALDQAKQQMLTGHLGDVAPWQRLVDQINGLVPKPEVINVKFIDHSDFCVVCRVPLPPVEERQPKPAQKPNIAPVDIAPVSPADEPAKPVEAKNVVPLRPEPAPSSPSRFTGDAATVCGLLNGPSAGNSPVGWDDWSR